MRNALSKAWQNSTWQIILTVSLVFIFIFVDVLCGNLLGIVYEERPRVEAVLLFLGFGILQIIFAPLQSATSDVYGRKKSLVISLFFSLVSLALIYFFKQSANFLLFLIFSTLFKGIMGNTLPMSLALIADTRYKNYRLLFICSTGAYALAYLLLASADFDGASFLENKINFYLILSVVVAIIICILFLKNQKNNVTNIDENLSLPHVLKTERKLLIEDLKHTPTRRGFTAFYLWETSLYVILLSQVDFHINKISHIAESMMYGYLLGVVILILSYRLRDSTVIKIGYYISFLSLIPYFVFFKIVEDQTLLLRTCYFFHALGNAFLSPAFLSMLAKEIKAHKQGRMYGLADSVDTLAYICGAIVLLIFVAMKLDVIYLVSFSFIVFAISWKYYDRFQNIE